jgi:hypothetical protein
MNTFNLINAIALLACILTPAYVLYFLKYHIKQEQKHQKKMIDVLDAQLCDHSIVINKIQTDSLDDFEKRQQQLKEINHNIERNDVKFKMFKSVAENNFDNINVQQDYFRRTLDKEVSSIHDALDLIVASHDSLEHKTSESIKKLNSEVDSLQSLNITTQNILKRINSKEFTTELVRQWLITLNQEKKEKEERDAKRSKLGRPKKQKIEEQEQEQEVKETKPTEAIVSDVVNIMKDNEQKVVKLKTPKAESKRIIRSRELEAFFKENTKLTYRGFVIKYGEEAFKRERNLVYKRLYYMKFQKKTTESEKELSINKTDK